MGVKKILIVEDEVETLDLIAKRLIRNGYGVCTATCGREASALVKKENPDIVLMDVILPDMDGPEVVKALLHDPETSTIPVIFLSGIVTVQDGRAVSEITVASRKYRALGKPFTFKNLLTEIQRTFDLIG